MPVHREDQPRFRPGFFHRNCHQAGTYNRHQAQAQLATGLKPRGGLRSQSGQNGEILFISGEELSLIVAGDSAKTLSVLGNMGDALDDCGLRFVQKCRRPPQNTPILGVQRIFSKSCLLSHHPELAPPGLPDHPGGSGGFFMA